MNEPDKFDYAWRGFTTVVFGPWVVLILIASLPFMALGWLTHKCGWTVKHEEPMPGEW